MSDSREVTFYWHDYETFGADPALDRPAQFAGIRTDAELNIVGEPLVIYCRPANDFLPQPGACLVTGITPQQAMSEGLPECQFIERIHRELALPGTCGVGYNSLRFDDEVTRHTLYRNFFDPYAREWQDGNSRWDIIDMVRTAFALRPEGVNWPLREDGQPSFRLEELTAANAIEHEGAHDALSDVLATIALARLIRERQPRLYEHLVRHRDKQAALEQLHLADMKPVLHISGMFGAARGNAALIAPLAMHPDNRNEVICWDLSVDPAPTIDGDIEFVQTLLYTRTEELPENVLRPGFKSVRINRCPVLLSTKMLDSDIAERLGIDGESNRRNLAMLHKWRDSDPDAFKTKVQSIFSPRPRAEARDPDRMLYSGGFFSASDKRLMDEVRRVAPEELATQTFAFEDKRLTEMLFRYRARNYPDTLLEEERLHWEEYRFARLTDPEFGASICMEQFQAEIDERLSSTNLSDRDRDILEALLLYADELLA